VDFTFLIWVFILAGILYPMLQQRSLVNARLRLMSKIEQTRGSRVIALIHRQESISFLGLPIMRFIDIEDSEGVLRAIRMTPDDMPIDIILHTPGGTVLASGQIAHALKRHPAKVTAHVPHYAMSGGTMISLACDEIVMDPDAVLGPVDPQIGGQPAVSILKVLEQKEAGDIDDDTLILADVSRKAINQVRECIVDHLLAGTDEQAAADVAVALTDGRWTHDFPICLDEARRLGLRVSDDLPPIIHELMDLYPQPQRARPSVEYVPLPYHQPGSAPSADKPPSA